MQLFIGGAHAGKRAAVRARLEKTQWHSAYQGAKLQTWRAKLAPDATLVVEGWEQWLEAVLSEDDSAGDDRLRQAFAVELDALKAAERDHARQVVLIMLEMGHGIVPRSAHERRLRDLAGWLAQDAAARADQVWYVWHGLTRPLG